MFQDLFQGHFLASLSIDIIYDRQKPFSSHNMDFNVGSQVSISIHLATWFGAVFHD